MFVALRDSENTEPEQGQMRFREHTAVQSKNDFFMVDPRKLKVDDGYNVRDLNSKETREHVAGLKASIIANGVKVPLEVRLDGKFIYVVAGHCRLAAVMEAISDGEQIAAVPCIPEGKGTSEIDRTVNLIVSNSGKPLAPLEVAAVVKRLIVFGHSEKQIAERLGWKSTNTVKQHLELLAISEPIKEHVRAGDISPTLARQISKNVDPATAKKLIDENLAENKRIKGTKKRSIKVTARTIKRDKPKVEPTATQAPAPAPPAPPDSMTVNDDGSPISEAQKRRYAMPSQVEVDAADCHDYRPTQESRAEINGSGDIVLERLIELTKQAHLCVQHNQSDDHPGWWSNDLVEAIRKARDVVERLTGAPMEFAEVVDPVSQEADQHVGA